MTGDRSVGRSTIPPQGWSGVAHVAPAQKSLLTDCGGASMTPCSMPWPAGRQAKRPDQSLRASNSWGGWSNGVWSPRLRRVGAGRAERNTPVESGLRPFLEPLGSPPLSWQFVDAQKVVSCAALAGVRTLRSGRPFLPADAALIGFENAIPHLRRGDGKAVMFPYQIRSSLDKDGYYVARTQFFYADEDVFFRLDGHPSIPRKGSPGTWEFDLDELTDLGVRREP